MPRYSQKPPSMAPIKFAPNAADGDFAARNVVEKMMPAKNTGRGTASNAHSSRPVKSKARTVSRGTASSNNSVANNGAYSRNENARIRSATVLPAITIRRTPATTIVVTSHVVPK